MSKTNIFLFSTDCKLVKGLMRGLLIDAQRNEHFLVPNSVIEFINKANKKALENIYKLYSEQLDIVEEYIHFLDDKELIIWLDSLEEVKFFPKKSLDWDYPALISNAVISISYQSNISYLEFIVEKLELIQCYNILIKFEGNLKLTQIINYLNQFNESMITFIEVSLECNDKEVIDELIEYSKLNARIAQLSFFDCSVSKDSYFFDDENNRLVLFSAKRLSVLNCGITKPAYFNNLESHYTESLVYNSCLNRKLSIDAEGNIKNCPSITKSYGNINDPNLDIKAIACSEEFQAVWHINKDKIDVCKVCEFRHVCTDCRAYIEDPEDIYSKPLKCGYNPYTCEWEEWSTHPMKQKAIDYYGMREIIKSQY